MKYKNEEVTETDLYKKLGLLTKNKDEWESSISDVATLLKSESPKIQAKALWMLGEKVNSNNRQLACACSLV